MIPFAGEQTFTLMSDPDIRTSTRGDNKGKPWLVKLWGEHVDEQGYKTRLNIEFFDNHPQFDEVVKRCKAKKKADKLANGSTVTVVGGVTIRRYKTDEMGDNNKPKWRSAPPSVAVTSISFP